MISVWVSVVTSWRRCDINMVCWINVFMLIAGHATSETLCHKTSQIPPDGVADVGAIAVATPPAAFPPAWRLDVVLFWRLKLRTCSKFDACLWIFLCFSFASSSIWWSLSFSVLFLLDFSAIFVMRTGCQNLPPGLDSFVVESCLQTDEPRHKSADWTQSTELLRTSMDGVLQFELLLLASVDGVCAWLGVEDGSPLSARGRRIDDVAVNFGDEQQSMVTVAPPLVTTCRAGVLGWLIVQLLTESLRTHVVGWALWWGANC